MPEDLLPEDPVRVGEYELTARLGDGGQGSVYLARDGGGREVAVKLLHARLSRDAASRARFVRELEVAERVAGFCTAQVLDADIDGDRPYIVSEFVDGPSLLELVRRDGPLDPAALLRLAIGTATALAAIHRAGVVHRDFKPPNVLIGPGGPRVIDFGIARALDSAAVTMTSQVVGTPAYMAPEQVAGTGVGPAADVFAWGGTMLFAATGGSPFGADSIPAVMHRVLNAEADLRALPEPLAGLVGACLAKDPGRRPSSSDALLRLLDIVGTRAPAGQDTAELLERGATLVTMGLTEVPFDPPPPQVTTGVTEVAFGPPLPQVTRPAGGRPDPLKRKLVIGGAVLGVGLLIVVPGVGSAMNDRGGGPAAAGAAGTVTIGYLGPLTGDNASLGTPALAAARLAVAEHNARKPQVRARLAAFDTGGTDMGAKQAARQAVDAKAGAVVGPMLSVETKSAMPILEESGIPSVSPGAAGTLLSKMGWKYWHSMVPNAQESVGALAEKVADDKDELGTVAVLEDREADSRNAANVFAAGLETEGVQVRRFTMPPQARFGADADHAATIAELRRLNARTVFYGGAYPVSGPLIGQARKAGITARFYLSDLSMSSELTKLAGAPAAEGAVVACSCLPPESPAQDGKETPRSFQKFIDAFGKANGGARPGPYGPEGYDATWAVLHALAKGKRSGPEINAFLGGMDEPGATQRIRFSERGELTDSRTYLFTVRAGGFAYSGDA